MLLTRHRKDDIIRQVGGQGHQQRKPKCSPICFDNGSSGQWWSPCYSAWLRRVSADVKIALVETIPNKRPRPIRPLRTGNVAADPRKQHPKKNVAAVRRNPHATAAKSPKTTRLCQRHWHPSRRTSKPHGTLFSFYLPAPSMR